MHGSFTVTRRVLQFVTLTVVAMLYEGPLENGIFSDKDSTLLVFCGSCQVWTLSGHHPQVMARVP